MRSYCAVNLFRLYCCETSGTTLALPWSGYAVGAKRGREGSYDRFYINVHASFFRRCAFSFTYWLLRFMWLGGGFAGIDGFGFGAGLRWKRNRGGWARRRGMEFVADGTSRGSWVCLGLNSGGASRLGRYRGVVCILRHMYQTIFIGSVCL